MIMTVRHLCRIASLTMVVLSLTEVRSHAQTAGVKNIVLVHGAWADGSSWAKVIPLLQARGLHVVAVQNPLTSLADDVAATKRHCTAGRPCIVSRPLLWRSGDYGSRK